MSDRQTQASQTTSSIQPGPFKESGPARVNFRADSTTCDHGAFREIGIPQVTPWVSPGPAPRIDSEVSIGPLLTGIAMMMFVRRHRH